MPHACARRQGLSACSTEAVAGAPGGPLVACVQVFAWCSQGIRLVFTVCAGHVWGVVHLGPSVVVQGGGLLPLLIVSAPEAVASLHHRIALHNQHHGTKAMGLVSKVVDAALLAASFVFPFMGGCWQVVAHAQRD